MGLVPFPVTAISSGTEYTKPITAGQKQALCDNSYKSNNHDDSRVLRPLVSWKSKSGTRQTQKRIMIAGQANKRWQGVIPFQKLQVLSVASHCDLEKMCNNTFPFWEKGISDQG